MVNKPSPSEGSSRSDGIDFQKRPKQYEDEEVFEGIARNFENVKGYLVVGIETEAGDVLLQNDGSHGWSLPATQVATDREWIEVGQEFVENVSSSTTEITSVERVRRKRFTLEGADRDVTIHEVVLRATTDSITDGGRTADDDEAVEYGWHREIPIEDAGEYPDLVDDLNLFFD